MADVIQAIVNGILIGGVYAIVSVGLSLVFGVMDIVNFAQAEFLMVGMFGAYFLSQALGIDPILLAGVVFIFVFVLGAVVQRTLIQPVLNAPLVSQIFLTVGLSIVLQSAAQVLFGANFRSVETPYQVLAYHFGPIQINVTYLLAFASSMVVVLLLWLFLERTDLGRAMRATAENRTAATLVGINTRLMYVVAFGLGAGLAGVAGAVILPYVYVFPTVGQQYALIMFTAVVLGGLGSIPGALLGGLLIGVTQSLSSLFLPIDLQNLIVFILFILILTYRPNGLLGRKAA